MARTKTTFICKECGSVFARWTGQCSQCKQWNSLTEENNDSMPHATQRKSGIRKSSAVFHELNGESQIPTRITSGIGEFDRVCGGGLVNGSVLLVGGDPGIGKSTLLLQILSCFSNKGKRCIYISGEESIDQIRLRAKRLKLQDSAITLSSVNDMEVIISSLSHFSKESPVIVIDSIQTLYFNTIDAAPGTVSQMRNCAHSLVRLAKKQNMTILIIGHVTKEGTLAGPRLVEHMVDAVLYFEGERSNQFRILRTVKNRFGPTDEIGIFDMTGVGLQAVDNPAELFIESQDGSVPGSVVFAAIEGTRPMLIEIQALVAPSSMAMPRRAVIGWDSHRLAMILAVLERWLPKQRFVNCDVYLNIAGGLKISEPAADLAVAAALLSARSGRICPENTVFFGEIGLAGQVRPSPNGAMRLKEAQKLGFHNAIIAEQQKAEKSKDKLHTHKIKSVHALLSCLESAPS